MMPKKSRKLVIVGDSSFAEIAREYFGVDTHYEVVAFAVERAYLKASEKQGLPVVAFETLHESHPPADHDIYVAIVYTQLNRLRARLAQEAKQRGYALASYVSPRAFVWKNVEIGEHCFIFEDNTVQPFVRIGRNVVLWSGNHIGHHSVIRDNVFISSHVVISGHCDIGENCFLGVNSTVIDTIKVGRDGLIGAGALIARHTEEGKLYKGNVAEVAARTAKAYFKVPE